MLKIIKTILRKGWRVFSEIDTLSSILGITWRQVIVMLIGSFIPTIVAILEGFPWAITLSMFIVLSLSALAGVYLWVRLKKRQITGSILPVVVIFLSVVLVGWLGIWWITYQGIAVEFEDQPQISTASSTTNNKYFRGETINISDLAKESGGIIRGMTFHNCTILGPAMLVFVPLSKNVVVDSRIRGAVEAVLWEIPIQRKRVIGGIPVESTNFIGCDFRNIGFAGNQVFAREFAANIRSEGD